MILEIREDIITGNLIKHKDDPFIVNTIEEYTQKHYSFSYLLDGRRRVCAMVKVNNGLKESFILEVAVPDRSLSTLIVPSSGSAYRNEIHIQRLLTKLVLNSGSWSNSFLKNQVHNKIRHSNETAMNWAQKIRNYIY